MRDYIGDLDLADPEIIVMDPQDPNTPEPDYDEDYEEDDIETEETPERS